MKHRKALTTILGVIIAVSFYLFYVIDIGREMEDEVLIPALLIGMLLIWANFVAGESWLTEKGLDVGLYPDSRNP